MANSRKEEVTTVEPETPQNHYSVFHNRQSWLVPVLIVIIILLLIGLFAQGHRNRLNKVGGFGGYGMMQPRERAFRRGGAGFGVNANQNRIQGVVTAVNGSSFTVAGGGSTNEVTTNGSTQYQGGSQPKVNDTVMVLGTTNNGTFTATQVVINP